jgi:putative ATP-dependent endonuclease of the OLD family
LYICNSKKAKKQPMSILIDKVRIKNFRSLRNVEVNLQPITLLVGANNAGKTTFLRALNTVFGFSKGFLTKDDLFIDKNGKNINNAKGELEPIIIDIRIVPINEKGQQVSEFDNEWNGIFGSDGKKDAFGRDIFIFRTVIEFKNEGDNYETNQYFLTDWKNPNPKESDRLTSSIFKSALLYFMDAQRDLQSDIKLRNSYFGKLAAKTNYEKEAEKNMNDLIKKFNDTAISESEVLSHLKETLLELNHTTYTNGAGVSINAISRNIRDMHKGMTIDFQDSNSDTFSLEYHGMGTRSWASILSLAAFTSWEVKNRKKKEASEPYFPILAIEEPESHLHPNGQRTLYNQLKKIGGQKIISTHSPYIAGQAELKEVRHFYKSSDEARVSELLFSHNDEIRIGELLKEIEENGGSSDIKRQNHPIIANLKQEKNKKLNEEESRKIKREVMNTRGELLFAKAMILFESETEEQALPILAKEYFGCYPHELGLNFIGVGGKGKYQPFLNVAKFLNIPWYILSDGDGSAENDVKIQITGIFGESYDTLFVLSNTDFEGYLLQSGFKNELISAINQIKGNDFRLLKKKEKKSCVHLLEQMQ